MTIVEMLVRGAALEPMFCGQGPDIRGRSNAKVIQAAKDYVQATGGASSFSVEIVIKDAVMRCCCRLLNPPSPNGAGWRMYAGTAIWTQFVGTVTKPGLSAFEAGRRETMDYLRSGRCAP
jgi:hypothetical protein